MQELVKQQKEVFAIQVDSVKRMVGRYDLANQDIDKLNEHMGSYLAKMEEPFLNDTAWSGRMHKNIIELFVDLKKAKTEINKLGNELNDCKKDLEKAKEEGKTKDTM